MGLKEFKTNELEHMFYALKDRFIKEANDLRIDEEYFYTKVTVDVTLKLMKQIQWEIIERYGRRARGQKEII